MDVSGRVELVERAPTEEIVTRKDLVTLFETNDSPKHYIGLEISGFLHLGSLLSTGFKINDFAAAGVNCTIFLADWHTFINDKLGGSWDAISRVSGYYADAFRRVCPGARILLGSDLYDSRDEYWQEFVRFTKHMSLARTLRTMTILGRNEEEEKVDLSKLLYPPMQAVDIHSMDLDIAHSGMDQRKIHMLVREVFPKMKWKVPVAVHHGLLPGLGTPQDEGRPAKMSKSDPDSGVFMHDTDEEIESKIKKAWCEEGVVENNPLLAITRNIIFHEFDAISIERPARFGGDTEFGSYAELHDAYAKKTLHPADLKSAVAGYLTRIVAPIREGISLDDDLRNIIMRSA